MSLAVLADHMASKGRGPDSMLIHMSPREVQGLQALAENHGGSLTINPETGLPEAGILDKLLPAIIGFGLNYFAPGFGSAIAGGLGIGGASAAAIGTGIGVGGFEALRTGDIGKGISAGLGAYGGAGLQTSLANAGTSALSSEAARAGAGLTADMAANLADAGITDAGIQSLGNVEAANQALQQQAAERVAAASPFERMSAGFDAAKANPSSLLTKDNFKYLGAAAAPILADQAVKSNLPTTTTKPGMIRPYSFDPYGGTYTAGTPYEAQVKKAAYGGLMGLAAGGIAGYGDGDDVPRQNGMAQGGMYDFAQRSEPVVRMAEGGDVKHFVIGGAVKADIDKAYAAGDYAKVNELAQANKITATDVADTYKGFDASGLAAKGINLFTPPPVDYNKVATDYVTTAAANPNITASDFITGANTAGIGLTKPLETALNKSGLSLGAQYALTHAIDDKGYTGGIVDARTGKPVDFYNQIGYTAGALPGDQGGLKGLYANINYGVTGLQNLINSGKMTVADAQNAALAELARADLNLRDVKAATGKDFGNLFTAKKDDKVVVTGTGDTGGGTTIITGINDYGLGGTGTSGRLEDVYGPSLPPGVSGAGITTVNPNGTITTRPDLTLPMSTVRDDYVRGGGNLGYTSPTFASLKAVEDKYPLRGGSKQSYDFLTGKTDYDPVPYTKTGELMKPYGSSVLGVPMASAKQMYIFKNGKYEVNPDYAIPTYDKDGKKSLAITNQDVINYVKSPEYSNDDAFVSWMTSNNLTPEQIAAATGMSIADVYKKIKKAKPVEKTAAADTSNQLDSSSTGGAAAGGLMAMARGGMAQQFNLGDYSDGGRLLRGPGDGVSDSIPASIGGKRPARLADGEFVVPARIVSELGNGSTEAGARKLYAMMDRIQSARRGTVGRGRVAKNSRSDKHLPA